MHPFCSCNKSWQTKEDETVTVAEVLDALDWDGSYLHITCSQENDYTGASSLFNVSMSRDLVVKFFGSARVFSAGLHECDEISVADKFHFFGWANENGFQEDVKKFADKHDCEDLRPAYTEYKRLFPNNCPRLQSRMRISV